MSKPQMTAQYRQAIKRANVLRAVRVMRALTVDEAHELAQLEAMIDVDEYRKATGR